MKSPDPEVQRKVAQWLAYAEELTPYAVTVRYPGEDNDVSQEEAKQCIEIAQRVRLQVRAKLEP